MRWWTRTGVPTPARPVHCSATAAPPGDSRRSCRDHDGDPARRAEPHPGDRAAGGAAERGGHALARRALGLGRHPVAAGGAVRGDVPRIPGRGLRTGHRTRPGPRLRGLLDPLPRLPDRLGDPLRGDLRDLPGRRRLRQDRPGHRVADRQQRPPGTRLHHRRRLRGRLLGHPQRHPRADDPEPAHRPCRQRCPDRRQQGADPLRRLHHLDHPLRPRADLGGVRSAQAGMARQDRRHLRGPPGGPAVTASGVPPEEPPGAAAAGPPPSPPGTVSPDGRWMWNGQQWHPAPPPPPPPGYPPQAYGYPPSAHPAQAPPGYGAPPPPGFPAPGYPGYPGSATPTGPAPGAAFAGLLQRAGAVIIDGLIFLVPAIVFFVILGVSSGQDGGGNNAGIALGALGLVLLAIAACVYQVVLPAQGGTWGMRMVRIRVARADNGANIGIPLALGRWAVMAVISFFGFYWLDALWM